MCMLKHTHAETFVHGCTFWRDQSCALAQGAEVSKQDPAITSMKNISPRQSGWLSCPNTSGPWRLKGRVMACPWYSWKAQKMFVVLAVPQRPVPFLRQSPHCCQGHSLYPQFLQAFLLTKLAWQSGNEALLFPFFFFLLCNHTSVFLVLPPQRRCGCRVLWLPLTTLWSSRRGQCLDGMKEQQEFKPSHGVVSEASDARSSVVLKSPESRCRFVNLPCFHVCTSPCSSVFQWFAVCSKSAKGKHHKHFLVIWTLLVKKKKAACYCVGAA